MQFIKTAESDPLILSQRRKLKEPKPPRKKEEASMIRAAYFGRTISGKILMSRGFRPPRASLNRKKEYRPPHAGVKGTE